MNIPAAGVSCVLMCPFVLELFEMHLKIVTSEILQIDANIFEHILLHLQFESEN